MAVNSKEYLELFASKYLNKKHKGIKKGSSGLGFENFSKRIGSLVNFDTFNPHPHGTKQISRLTVISGEMVKSAVTKNKFLLLNDKRFYFPDGLVSLPFYHPILAEIDNFKQKKGQKIKFFWEEKENLFRMEKKTLKNHPRLYFYHQILTSTPVLFKRNTKYIRWVVVEMNYNYDAKFEGNILVVERTSCGKTTFVQNLGKNSVW